MLQIPTLHFYYRYPSYPRFKKSPQGKNFSVYKTYKKKTQNNKQSKKPKQELNKPYSVNYHEWKNDKELMGLKVLKKPQRKKFGN